MTAQEAFTSGYVQQVPDKCDRIVWRNQYWSLPPVVKVPTGWKLVPTEPTPEMVWAGFTEAGGSYENKEAIYHAMLAAAPAYKES